MNNFSKRVISGFLFVVILTACIFIHPFCFFGLFFVINAIGILEFAHMASVTHIKINRVMCLISGSTLFTAGFLDNYLANGFREGYLYFFILTFILCISELYRKRTHAFQNVAFSIYVLFYITLPFTLLVYLPYMSTGDWQPQIIFFPFLLVWFNDTFAYLFGSQLGKHKLFPRISPKKSWEGAIGGGLTTLAVGFLIAPYIEGLNMVDTTIISLIVVIFGIFGDLIESMFKRCIEIKDSGHIMPGHGGVLDRLDSIIFAIPAIFVYMAFRFGL